MPSPTRHAIHERRREAEAAATLSVHDEMLSKAYDWLYLLYPEYTDNSSRIAEPFPTGLYKVFQSVDREV